MGLASLIPSAIKNEIKQRVLHRFGHADRMEDALSRIARSGLSIASWIDVGASDGRWSLLAAAALGDRPCLLVEAQPTHRTKIQTNVRSLTQARLAFVAAGRETSQLYFDASDPFGGTLLEKRRSPTDIEVPVRSLDQLVEEHALKGPYFLKLDTHGVEPSILAGARSVLAQASVVMIEAYNFELIPGCLRFHELIAFMETQGFRVFDLVDLMRRPKDGLFWQMDLIFVKASHPGFASNTYA